MPLYDWCIDYSAVVLFKCSLDSSSDTILFRHNVNQKNFYTKVVD